MSTTATKPTYLYPDKVRRWLIDRLYNNKALTRDLQSGKWVKVHSVYTQMCDEVLEEFKPFICEWMDIKHFEQLVLDYIDPLRSIIAKPATADAKWPLYDPEKFQEGEFYID